MDTIGDLITRIRNGYAARKERIVAPFSSLSRAVCVLLVENQYLRIARVVKTKTKLGSDISQLAIELRYESNEPVLTGISRMSKPGRRRYLKHSKLPRVMDGFGLAIVSTPAGIMTDVEARKKKLGGELLFTVW